MRRIPSVPAIMASACATLALSASAMAAQTGLTISSAATENMQCSSGVCAPTAANAVLNAGDLKTMLATGNVEVTTTGSGIQANNIQFDAPFSWSGTSTLWLDAYANIVIADPITVKGAGGLTLTSGSGNTLFFPRKGEVAFKKVTSILTINGNSYALVNDIATLASAIASNPAGDYALAGNYNAARDGTYSEAPIQTTFTGIFEGLGHRISNLTIDYSGASQNVGLFAYVDSSPGNLRDIGLPNANVAVAGETGETYSVGALAGATFDGEVFNAFATGSVAISGAGSGSAGGLVGAYGAIVNSYATDSVSASSSDASGAVAAGGLAGGGDYIVNSYATGDATAATAGPEAVAGGLLGNQTTDLISNSYATGAASASTSSSSPYALVAAGGIVGAQEGEISSSYSTGTAVASGASSDNYAGGAVGWVEDSARSTFTDVYWDTSTSGTDTGVGNGSYSGLTGLTTLQLQSGLPAGFQSSVWREKAKVNQGLPYLLTIPSAR